MASFRYRVLAKRYATGEWAAENNGMIEVDGVPIDAAPTYDPGHGWLDAAETALLTISEFRRQAEIKRRQKDQVT